ncbi:MAG TPA: Ig-like domain-containing protein [Polyangia bacterium]|nr:Ig-like domain-containing protein [Polyangia bacterium]
MLISCSSLACNAPAPGAPRPRLLGYGGDTVLEPAGVAESALGGAAPSPEASTHVLFLNFGGEALTQGSSDNAPNGVSVIAGTQVPQFNGAVNAPKVTRQNAIDAVVDRLRTFYAPYNLDIVTTRPGSGAYTVIEIGGSHTIANEPSGVAGVSPLDCSNSNPSNVVFDFSDDQTPDYGGVVAVAITGAHESGHSYGLEHTDNPLDIMYSVAMPMQQIADLFNMSFATGNFSGYNAGEMFPSGEQCGRSNPLDNDAILRAALGSSTRSDTTKPTLTWSFPPAQQVTQVTPSFPIIVAATDNVSVKRVEVYKNLELVAVLATPPYNATITAASGENFYLTVEAMDDAANRVSESRLFAADVKNPPLCPPGTNCPAGRTCAMGQCRLALGQACMTSADCATAFCRTVGGATQKTCTAVCSPALTCPEGGMCENGLCAPSMTAPAPKMDGEACAMGTECASGRCSSVCVPACENNPCDPSLTCAAVDGGMGCVAPDQNLMEPPPPTQASGCAVEGTRATSDVAALVLLAAIALVLRRRIAS